MASPTQFASNNPFREISNTRASSDIPSHTPQTIQEPLAPPKLAVKFTWKKWRGIVVDANNPKSDPLYSIHFPVKSSLKREASMFFKKMPSGETIASGKLSMISINPRYELHGQKAQLLAQKRMRTAYTHRSLNFSNTDTPVTMTWSRAAGFKTWDFVCVDEQQNAVAKFATNPWGVTNIGTFEFDGPKKNDTAAREEILVTGITLFYCMLVRSNNIGNLFGAIFSRPGKKEHVDPQPKAGTSETSTHA